MISDTLALAARRADWIGMEKYWSSLHGRSWFSNGIQINEPDPPDSAYSLVFLHGCAILNDVLITLRDQGVIKSKARTLGALVEDAKNSISWISFGQMKDTIVKQRNRVAHDSVILPKSECRQHINSIADQLRDWGIVT